MTIIETYPCKSKDEKEKREFYWIKTLKPTLNSVVSFLRDENSKDDVYYKLNKQNTFNCECGSHFKLMNKRDHLNSDKHKNFVEKEKKKKSFPEVGIELRTTRLIKN